MENKFVVENDALNHTLTLLVTSPWFMGGFTGFLFDTLLPGKRSSLNVSRESDTSGVFFRFS